MSNYRFRETRYGFDYGPLKVQRVATDPKAGIIIHVGSEHKQFQVRVSPKGRNVDVHETESVYWHEEDTTDADKERSQ